MSGRCEQHLFFVLRLVQLSLAIMCWTRFLYALYRTRKARKKPNIICIVYYSPGWALIVCWKTSPIFTIGGCAVSKISNLSDSVSATIEHSRNLAGGARKLSGCYPAYTGRLERGEKTAGHPTIIFWLTESPKQGRIYIISNENESDIHSVVDTYVNRKI